MNLAAKNIHKKMPDYTAIKKLYKNSFPRKEQIPLWILRIMVHRKTINAKAFYDGDKLCGFAYIIEQEKILYILYLAVSDAVRGQGYGSEIIKWLRDRYPDKTILLEVEASDENADNAQERNRRIAFYKKNGIYETKEFFSMRGVRYEILSSEENFVREDYDAFWKKLFRR